jgi:hypothetical protein
VRLVLDLVLQLGPCRIEPVGFGCCGCTTAEISPRSSRRSGGQGRARRHAAILARRAISAALPDELRRVRSGPQ